MKQVLIKPCIHTQAYLLFALFVCLGCRTSRQEWSMVFKSWESLEKNTEGKKGRRGGEIEKEMEETKKGKRIGGVEGGVFSFFISTAMASGHHTHIYSLNECLEEASITNRCQQSIAGVAKTRKHFN